MNKNSNKIKESKELIAVIGMECIFPKAPNMKVYWQNILNKVNAVGEPLDIWHADHYLDNGYISTSKGGYLKDLYRFNPAEFGVMPTAVDGGEPDQFIALQVAKRALEDAGEQYLHPDYNHRDTGIILGHSTYLHRGQVNGAQHYVAVDQTIEILKLVLPSMTDEQSKQLYKLLSAQLPRFNADTCPAMVPNAMTGRIANRLNFTGPNYILDAACASSLLSIGAAIEELRSGRSRMMLAGGINAALPAEVDIIFTLLDALSKKGMLTPFSKDSDGTLLGEGAGVIVLKRLSDALEDGDRIYSVVHGVGQSSDGRGHGLLAPSAEGEALAMSRAYEDSGIDPSTIGLIEAHGTGIALGDKTEISSLKQIFGERLGEQGNIAVGSVKSMISHCIPAAGAASFIKTSLALYHKILPPTLCNEVNPELGISDTALYVNTEAKPWISKDDEPCRAAINSFGFGGVNAHAILEEAPANSNRPKKCSAWEFELFVFKGKNASQIQTQLEEVQNFISKRDDVLIEDVAFTVLDKALNNKGSCRLAIMAGDLGELSKKIDNAKKKLDKGDAPFAGKNGVVYSNRPVEGKVGFMFPGEGSQYINMLSDLAMHFEPVRKWFGFWHGLYDETPGSRRTDIVFPVQSELTEQRKAYVEKRIHDMDIGSEAVFVGGQAMFDLIRHFDVEPDVMVGHSSGESGALVASRAIPWRNRKELAELVREVNRFYRIIEEEGGIERGVLMAIALISQEKIQKHLEGTKVVIAMENCPTQTIVYGSVEDIDELAKVLIKEGAICEKLPFDRGYHTEAFAPMKDSFHKYYEDNNLVCPEIPLYSCASADLFPKDPKEAQSLAAAQWIKKVRFVDTVEKMYEDGVRYFIEVGPSSKLAAFAEQILRKNKTDKECVISSSNIESKPGLFQFLNLAALLFVNDKFNVEKLFADREVQLLDFSKLEKEKLKGIFLDSNLPRLKATDELREFFQKITPVNQILQQAPIASGEDIYAEHRPFISEIKELTADKFIGSCYLSAFEDKFLQDHTLSGAVSDVDPNLFGLPCVPLMVSLEIMAQGCSALAGSIDLRVIEDIRTFNWIALDSGEVNLEIRVNKLQGKENGYFAELYNNGSKVMNANYYFGETADYICEALPDFEAKQEPYRWSGEYEMYGCGMFHGSIFQTIRYVDKWNDNAIEAELSTASLNGFFRDGETPKMVLNPALMDSLNQLTAFWVANKVGPDFNNFPSKVERMEFYSQCPQDIEGLRNGAIRKESDATGADGIWDIECNDASGNPVIRVKGLQNIFFDVPYNFYTCRTSPLEGWLGNPVESDDASINWHLEYLPNSFCTQSSGVLLRAYAYCILNIQEREQWNGLNVDIATKRSWIFQRACVKEAVRYHIYQQTGELLYPSDIEVYADTNGQYYVDGWWCQDDEYFIIDAPQLTIQAGNDECFVSVDECEEDYELQQHIG
ncbi:MAG: beta-ketoacyl synthase N-terminal-like domain-containing protein [Rickettsiales bacterium]|nr:beta-ketoacyl synthase N-terminal-like domain-containing protein [Pseudomonadota bacterium]MDA0965421.1 beta-ketoacyl synthase N-terminal-like domain-containing protein [Pseudomonadota bacterium]MDG4542746.1 beta-ketoacyl synthase N-terminal-like domain-containing protein [Rickettsiales bacterium]MDG4544806.1 beta-ketoacyl synthase N-terminal-like domain-containing protein [Rickettsiales bacterium]MDG4546928.1 beta-ketoacyl synthase N-terminal-like domain-containing protein [Rickettsiales ba